MRSLLLIITLLFTGCGRPGDKPETHLSVREQLEQRRSEYLTLLPDVQGEAGFVDADHCDSVLFSGLMASSGIDSIDVEAAEDDAKPGRWYRRPVTEPECYSIGASRSTISRDMLLGVMWWAWAEKRLDVLERMWSYGEARDWFMGDDSAGGFHTQLGPLIPLLAREILALGGEDHWAWRRIPLASESDEGKTDFEAHLQVLQIMLNAEVSYGVTEKGLARLREQAERQPGNPLFQYALHAWTDGQLDVAANLLLNEQYWPTGRLPTSADRCSNWVLERDSGADWEPCDAGRTHSGGDLLFTSWLILRSTTLEQSLGVTSAD